MVKYLVQARRINGHGSLATTKHAEITLDTDVKGREDAFIRPSCSSPPWRPA